MTRHLLSMAAMAATVSAVAAQGPVDPDEFLRLEPVLQRALAKAGPFVPNYAI